MKTRADLLAAWGNLLDAAQPKVSKAAHLAQVQELLDSMVIKLTDTWPDPVRSLLNAPPAGPATNDRYAVGPTPAGAWAGHAHQVAQWNGSAWGFTTPPNGTVITCTDDTTSVLIKLAGAFVKLPLPTYSRFRTTGSTAVSSTSLTPVSGLEAPVKSGRNYKVEADLLVTCSDAAYGLKVGLSGPTATTVAITARIPTGTTGGLEAHAAAWGEVGSSTSAPATAFLVHVEAVIVGTSSTDQVAMYVATSNATNTVTVHTASTITVTDITD